MASEIIAISTVCSITCSGLQQRKHRDPHYGPFVWRIQFSSQRATNTESFSMAWLYVKSLAPESVSPVVLASWPVSPRWLSSLPTCSRTNRDNLYFIYLYVGNKIWLVPLSVLKIIGSGFRDSTHLSLNKMIVNSQTKFPIAWKFVLWFKFHWRFLKVQIMAWCVGYKLLITMTS